VHGTGVCGPLSVQQDSSFWGWPELGLLPHWLLAHSADAQIAWSSKAKQVHWRGGLKRSGRLREAMVACAQRLSKSQPLQPQPAQPQPAHPQPAQQPLQPSHQDQQVLGPNDEVCSMVHILSMM